MSSYNDREYIDNSTSDPFFRSIMKNVELTPIIQLGLSTELYSKDGWTYPELSNNDVLVLPYTSKDQYSCNQEPIGSSLQMVSGRTVWEHRGFIRKIEYSYDYLPMDMWKRLSSILRSGKPFSAIYLCDNYEDYSYGDWEVEDMMDFGIFLCESLTPPKMAYALPGNEEWDDVHQAYRYDPAVPMWHGIQFTLREYTSTPKVRVPVFRL